MSIAEQDFPDLAADHPDQPAAASQGASLLSAFQATRRRLAQKGPREEIRQVPLWEGALRIRYRYPEDGADRVIRAFERVAEGRSGEDKRGQVFNANADVLIACCHDIEFRDPDSGEWAPLDENAATRFTAKLAQFMQLDVPDSIKSKARFIARHVFSPRAAETGEFDGDVGLLDQAGDVLNWLRGTDQQIDEDLRGE